MMHDAVVLIALAIAGPIGQVQPVPIGSCFLLEEVGKPEIRSSPPEACQTRVAPQSTFKIPHALAALDAGVIAGADTKLRYDGSAYAFDSWRRDHTLQSAMRYSAVWYFQRLAEQLGPERELDYLKRFGYGNADPSSGLTTFWLGGSLKISPWEQLRFMRRLFDGSLPVDRHAIEVVRTVLIQPRGKVVNAAGQHPFGTWPAGTVLRAKTGGGPDGSGREVRWLVGHVSRGQRAWIFVSCVIGAGGTAPLAAVNLAATELRRNRVL